MHHPEGAKTAEFVFNSTKECRPNVCRLKLQDGSFQSEESLFSRNDECCNFLHYNLRAHSAIMTNRCCHTVIAPLGSCAKSHAEHCLLNLCLWALI